MRDSRFVIRNQQPSTDNNKAGDFESLHQVFVVYPMSGLTIQNTLP